MTNIATFHPFPRLPTELRQKIWKRTLQPRVVALKFKEPTRTRWVAAGDEAFYSKISTPTALRVSVDSQAAVMYLYPLCFGNMWYNARVRLNYSLDTLFLDNHIVERILLFFSILRRQEVEGLRYLVLSATLPIAADCRNIGTVQFMSVLRRSIKSLEGLRQLIVVIDLNEQIDHNCNLIGRSEVAPVDLYDKLPPQLDNPELQLPLYPTYDPRRFFCPADKHDSRSVCIKERDYRTSSQEMDTA